MEHRSESALCWRSDNVFGKEDSLLEIAEACIVLSLPSAVDIANNLLTNGKADHGFIRVWGELHPIYDGPYGIQGVVSHQGRLHLPCLPAALVFDRRRIPTDAGMVNGLPVDSVPIRLFAIGVLVHLNQVRLGIIPATVVENDFWNNKIGGTFPLDHENIINKQYLKYALLGQHDNDFLFWIAHTV